MRPGGGKAKGAGFERQVCRTLSLWVTRGWRPDVLWRSAMSGGRATVSKKKGRSIDHVSGDICAVHEAGYEFVNHFYMECKNYKTFDWHRLLLTHDGRLAQYWVDTMKFATGQGKYPLLIFKQNGSDVLVAIELETASWFAMDEASGLFYVPRLDMLVLPLSSLVKCGRPWLGVTK